MWLAVESRARELNIDFMGILLYWLAYNALVAEWIHFTLFGII